MFLKSWLSTLVNRFRFNCNRRRHGLPPFLRQTKQQVHLFSRHNVGSFSGQSEQLEDRTLLAANITIVNGGGAADDGELADGQILFNDRVGEDLVISENALEALTSNITLEATSITVNDLTDERLNLGLVGAGETLTIRTSTGNFEMLGTASADEILTTNGAVVIESTAGGSLTIAGINTGNGTVDLTTTGAGDINIGAFAVAALTVNSADAFTQNGFVQSTTINITADNGDITQTAGTLVGTTAVTLTATDGIGPIDTQTPILQATSTTTGDISISNTGSVTLVGTGLQTQAAGGSITLTNSSNINVDAVVDADGAGSINRFFAKCSGCQRC